jgi:hypothetical protein
MTSNNLRLLGLLTAIIAVGSGVLLGCGHKMQTHEYIIVFQKQSDPKGGYQTGNFRINHIGNKFCAADVDWARTSIMGGNTNMAVVILNVIKLDD